jgi:hypothetical protein
MRNLGRACALVVAAASVGCAHRAAPTELMPGPEMTGPVPAAYVAMQTGRPYVYVRSPTRLEDHVRVWFVRDGAEEVVDFSSTLDGRSLFLEHRCPSPGDPAPLASPPDDAFARNLEARVAALIARSHASLGRVTRIGWLGRYRTVTVVQVVPVGAAPSAGDPFGWRDVRLSAVLFAADEPLARRLGDLCVVAAHAERVDGRWEAQPGRWLDLGGAGLDSPRDAIVAAALTALRSASDK